MYTFIFFIQEAFYLTDRVMTLSFHKYGNHFFPGTGKCIIYTVVYVVVQIFSLVWIFLNWFKFFKLVWNFQTGLKFLNTCLIVIYLYLCM